MYQIQKNNCTMCLGCLQACPLYAVELKDDMVSINTSRCVTCGMCLPACGHDAVKQPDQTENVQELIRSGRKVIVSLDPSCQSFLSKQMSFAQLKAAAKKLGFWEVFDSAEAVETVAEEYAQLLQEKRMENIILTQCPVIRTLVEQYHPELIKFLAPVASPMIAHGRMLKKRYPGAAVVYVSACGAKIPEAEDVRHSTEINAVISLQQLLNWIQSENINPASCSMELNEETFGKLSPGDRSAFSGGMMACMRELAAGSDYTEMIVDGLTQCMAVLDQLEHGDIHKSVLELSTCTGGCLGCPEGGLTPAAVRTAAAQIWAAAGHMENHPDLCGIAMSNPAIAKETAPFHLDETQVQMMLEHIGVANPKQQKNCGECGFPTCRERAEAILRHEEPSSLCRHAVQDIRTDIFSVVFDALPMAALLVDDHQKVAALNREAKELFSVHDDCEQYIFELMDPSDFQYVMDTGLAVKNRRLDIPEAYMRVEANLVPLRSLGMVLGLFEDITEVEEEEAQRLEDRLQSVEMAQNVIEKQMTVAQQIAYLLGETTAETKATLNQLKQRILEEEEQP